MTKATLTRASTLALTAALALAALASPAAARTKTKTVARCVPSGVTLAETERSFSTLTLSLGKLPKGAAIVDVNPAVRITQNDAYTQVLFASPGGKLSMLANGDSHTSTGDDFGTGPGCSGELASFDDEAATPFAGSTGPFVGGRQPLSPLAALDGGSAAGNFRFFISDMDPSAGTVGVVDAVGATVTYRYKVKKKKKKEQGRKSAASVSAKKGKKVNRTGSKDVCLNTALPVNNGPNDPPTSDRGTLGAVPLATGKIPQDAKVTDVDARVRLTHTYEGDIEFWLSSPNGTLTPLWIGANESESDFGSGAADCTGTPTAFDDEAATSIIGAPAPLAGVFKPILPLSGFDKGPAGGTWTLYVADHWTGDLGVLNAVGLNIDYRYRVVKKAKKKKK